MSRPERPGLNLAENLPYSMGYVKQKTSVATGDGKRENDRFPFPGLFPKVSAMATRLVFLAVVCVGSVALGQGQGVPKGEAPPPNVGVPATPSYGVSTTPTYGVSTPPKQYMPSTVDTPAPKTTTRPATPVPKAAAPTESHITVLPGDKTTITISGQTRPLEPGDYYINPSRAYIPPVPSTPTTEPSPPNYVMPPPLPPRPPVHATPVHATPAPATPAPVATPAPTKQPTTYNSYTVPTGTPVPVPLNP
jgi:hypothetical protein